MMKYTTRGELYEKVELLKSVNAVLLQALGQMTSGMEILYRANPKHLGIKIDIDNAKEAIKKAEAK